MRVLLLYSLLSSLLMAEKSKSIGLKLSLITERNAIVPGEPFTIGLHLEHDPGYHTYWKNPGIVGVPTSLKWVLPPGYTASEISWPYPELCDMAGHPCHGYERDVTLLTTITPPPQASLEKITIEVQASWMCCAQICHPGSKKLTLTLPISQSSSLNKNSAALMTKARQELPTSDQTWKGHLVSESQNSSFTIELQSKADERPFYFFSSDGQISSDQEQNFVQKGENTWALSISKSDFAPKDRDSLTGILQTTGGHYHIILK